MKENTNKPKKGRKLFFERMTPPEKMELWADYRREKNVRYFVEVMRSIRQLVILLAFLIFAFLVIKKFI